MKTRTYHLIIPLLVATFTLLATGARAQAIEEVLRAVEQNNKALAARQELARAERAEARAGNYLANPTADLEKLWGETTGSEYELTVKQSLDFPTAYGQRRVLVRLRENTAAARLTAFRQELLLEARRACIEIIYLRALQQLLDERLQNAERLASAYRGKLERGSANQLEVNKILLETLAARDQARANRAEIDAALERLQALNGGQPVALEQREFPVAGEIPPLERLQERYLAADPALVETFDREAIARQEARLARSLSLPKIDIGYKRAASTVGPATNGIVVGLSIPLFEHKNKVKSARARADFAAAASEEARLEIRSSLRRLHDRLRSLAAARADHDAILSGLRGAELLDKALAAGQITVIDYFVELTTLHDGRRRRLEIEREYHDTLARLQRLDAVDQP
ncbi:MAG: TolC family protein [Odoribacteraceae bacterium]|jgi:outer membrane protein TolC|nr:TolC family protein [Odoribacteraceae bacterium]